MKFQSPNDINAYSIDWSADLVSATILSSTWTSDAGITLSSQTSDASTATTKIEGGEAGKSYRVTNSITSSVLETFEDSFYIRIQHNHN